MRPLEIAIASVGLGVDAFSVCLGLGTRWHGPRQMFRLSWHMGLFQFFMPMVGFYASRTVADVLSRVDHWITLGVLGLIGGKMVYEAVRSHPGAVAEAEVHAKDPTRGWSLLALSVATSLDALAVGFAVGLAGKQVFPGNLFIGVVAGAMALAGVMIGKRVSQRFGKTAEIFGGVLLIGLGVYMAVR